MIESPMPEINVESVDSPHSKNKQEHIDAEIVDNKYGDYKIDISGIKDNINGF
jgi:hypothetical protein